MKKMMWLASVAAVLVSASLSGFAADGDEPYVIPVQGERMTVKSISATADGSITYQTLAGSTITWNARQYKAAYIPKPPEIAAMETAAAQKKYDEVIAQALKASPRNYKYLGWGALIGLLEGNAQAGRENYTGAIASYDQGLLAAAKEGAYESALYRSKVVALQKLGKTAEAKEILKKMFADADAKTAAAAFNTRAAMLVAEGSRKEALLDYMKTLLLCKEEEAAEERAVARAAVKELLKQLNDNRVAEIDKL